MKDIFRNRPGRPGECALLFACLLAANAPAACGSSRDSTLDATEGGSQSPFSGAPAGSSADGASAEASWASTIDGAAIRDGANEGRDDASADATHGPPITEGGSGPTDGRGNETGVDSAVSHGDGGGVSPCKRGIAANATPSSALAPTASSPGVSWWYNWSNQGATPPAGIEFVPMIWGSGSLGGPIPTGAKYLLGFNEPNFKSQSNLTPQQAAADWPRVETLAKAAAIPIVSPAVNFCGSASNPSGCSDSSVTDPYTYLKDFFAACTGCEVDAVAVHWYNCDLPSLQGYIEGNDGGLQGFTQFGKPIWLTEFSCDNSHSVAQQKAYMQAAVPWLENNPHIFRYSWFSATNISNALLMNSDGTLTDLGMTYVSLPQSCP